MVSILVVAFTLHLTSRSGSGGFRWKEVFNFTEYILPVLSILTNQGTNRPSTLQYHHPINTFSIGIIAITSISILNHRSRRNDFDRILPIPLSVPHSIGRMVPDGVRLSERLQQHAHITPDDTQRNPAASKRIRSAQLRSFLPGAQEWHRTRNYSRKKTTKINSY